MDKALSFMLILFLISGTFVAVFSFVSASDLVEDSWNTKTPMTQARSGFGVASVDGKIYAIGGSIKDVGIVGTNECYDPVSNIWITLESMPTPRESFAIAVYEGKIYCMGGYDYSAYSISLHESKIDLPTEVYDPVSNSWSSKASAPFANGTWQAHFVNGHIFVISANTLILDDYKRDWYVYELSTDSWSKRTRTPSIGEDIVSVLVNNNIIVLGTFPQESSDSRDLGTKVMLYNPRTDSWTAKKPGPILVGGGSIYAGTATTGIYAPKKVYFLVCTSKEAANALQMSNWVYDPVKDDWSTAEPMPIFRQKIDAVTIDDILYVIGGQQFKSDNSNIKDAFTANEQYVPISYGSVPFDFSLTNIVTILTVILICGLFVLAVVIIGIGLFLYFKRRGQPIEEKVSQSYE